jgi:hypothetical protein
MFITAVCIIILVGLVLGYALATLKKGEELSQPVWIFAFTLFPIATAFMTQGAVLPMPAFQIVVATVFISAVILAAVTALWWLFWMAFLKLGATKSRSV